MRHVWILSATQALCASGGFLMMLLGGIIGSRLAPGPALATLPISLMIVGLAASILPAGHAMRRIGRRRVFLLSSLLAAAGCLLAALAVSRGDFWLFCAAGLFIGSNNALVMQSRFDAAEYVEPELASRAIAIVMSGSLAAAVIGPELGVRAAGLVPGAEYAGSFVAASLLYVGAAWLLRHVPESVPEDPQPHAQPRALGEIAAQPSFLLAVLAALSAYAVMSFLMTATPISMHVVDHHDEVATKNVIQSHFLAMYLPSLASGWIIARLGVHPTIAAGALLMAGCVAISVLLGQQVAHYWWALVLLGVGWNLMFIAATTLLTRCYRPQERFRIQAVNDFVVFGSQAAASLLAGAALAAIGWRQMNLVTLPVLVAVLALAALGGRRRPAVA